MIIGQLPVRPIEKGMAEPGLLAHVVIEKYVDHMPLYRQVQRFTREGLALAASTLDDSIATSADLLVPLYQPLTQKALLSKHIQADSLPRLVGETPIAVQDTDRRGAARRGYYWLYRAPTDGPVVVDYQPGRGLGLPNALLKGVRWRPAKRWLCDLR